MIDDIITAKPSMKVTNGRPKPFCTNSAAPPALGYFVTSSA